MSHSESENLESLCINVIVCNFDLFSAAFSSKENNNLRFYLEFLQRHWSSRILKKLFQRYQLKDEHLEIVLNKYTRELDFQSISCCDSEAVISRLKEIGYAIQKVSMNEIAVFYNYDEAWKYLSNVQCIELQHSNCSNYTLLHISENCPHLKSLNLYGCCKVSDVGLTYLVNNKLLLESLNVERTSVTFRGVASVLKNITSLQELWYNNVPKAIFEAIGLSDTSGEFSKESIFNLNNIVISNSPFRPESHLVSILEVCRVVCPFIKDLKVTEIVSGRQLSLCSSFEELRCVDLKCSLINNPELCINDFLKIRGDKIHTLTLLAFSVSFDVLLNNCPNLEHLMLQYPSFENVPDTNSSTNFMHLKIFGLFNAELTSAEDIRSVACIISSSPNLQELNLCRCQLSNEITDIVLNCPRSLKILSFSNTSVEISFLEEILKVHYNLEVLRIDNSGITPIEYDDLMDVVEAMEKKINIVWADYTEAIRQLYNAELSAMFRGTKRQIMKL